MPKGQVQEGSDYRFTEGESLVRLIEVTERTVDFTYKPHHKAVQRGEARVGDPGQFSEWVWKVAFVNGPNAGDTLEVRTGDEITLKGWSPAREMYEAFLGQALTLGQDINTDIICGQTAYATTKNFEEQERGGSRVFYRSTLVDFRAADGASQEDPSNLAESRFSGSYSDEPPF